jgi:peptidoglycan/xylan/chitin deacetylase (PgdA/CDA1 family)
MIGSVDPLTVFFMNRVLSNARIGQWIAASAFGALACLTAGAASAADCPGHPNALGTSRTLVVDPREHLRIGTMQYPETLPLADHEVVLTFDDGPLPRNSNRVLEILASQCVKAVFFTLGQMAQSSPEGVRKLREAGHTIGTHSQTHPLSMNHMPLERAKQEIDGGIASVRAALGDDTDAVPAPFFRIPGLLRADNVEEYLASQGIQVWSADFPADDWHRISSSRVYELAIRRLEAKGKGILLLHDIQARTVAALPKILETLKARGYHIVQVVPATVERPATPTEPEQWLLHPPSANMVIARWPKIPNFAFADVGSLPVPALAEFEPLNGVTIAQAPPAAWPPPSVLTLEKADSATTTPASYLFEIPDGLEAALRRVALASHSAQEIASISHQAEQKRLFSERRDSRRQARGRLAHLGAGRHARRGPPKV